MYNKNKRSEVKKILQEQFPEVCKNPYEGRRGRAFVQKTLAIRIDYSDYLKLKKFADLSGIKKSVFLKRAAKNMIDKIEKAIDNTPKT